MGYYTLNERKVMKLSQKAKKNFEEDNEFYIHIGKKIKQAREENIFYIKDIGNHTDGQFKGTYRPVHRRISQQRLATALKTTFQQIGKYEKGQNRIPIVNLVRISKFLNKPLDYFLDINKETMIQSFMAKMNNEMRK